MGGLSPETGTARPQPDLSEFQKSGSIIVSGRISVKDASDHNLHSTM